MTQSFWKDALASLPSSVQHRYAADFEMAERLDLFLDLVFGAWGTAKPALAQICCAGAYTLRATAHMLESAAQRLLLVH
jgi:hypothetical protein